MAFLGKIQFRSSKKSQSIIYYGLVVSLILSVLSIFKPTVIKFLDNKVYDTLLRPTCNGETSGIPIIVDIDEKSLKTYGQWPWPRYRIAFLIEKLIQLKASSIGLDIMFPETDRTSIKVIKNELLRDFNINVQTRGMPQESIDNDKILADSLSKGPAVLGYQFLFDEEVNSDQCLLHPLNLILLRGLKSLKNQDIFLKASGVSCNLPVLSEAVTDSGFFNISPDSDGVLRKVPMIIEYEDKFYPSLSLSTLMQALNIKQAILKTDFAGIESLLLDKTIIPLSSKGNMLIRFRGKAKSFKYFSAVDILSDRIPASQIQGKIVFIGTSAAGLKEFRSTPVDPVFPGVEVHATIVDNFIKGDFISRPKWIPGFEFILVLASGLLPTLLLSRAGARWSLILFIFCAMGIWQISQVGLESKGFFISPILPLIALGSNFSILTLLKFWREERRVKERSLQLALAQEAIIESMASLTETRDPETGGHIKRTQNYIKALAESLKSQPKFRSILNDEIIELLYKSAPLHDIGKVGVPDEILLKPGKLTDEEFDEMKKHTVYGRDAIVATEKKLGNGSFLYFAIEIVYTHHERWDGSGYPMAIKEEEIPLSGRLMALADTYDALITKRVYKPPFSHEKAIEIIIEGKGTHFDPDIVDAFLKIEEKFRQIAIKYADSEEERLALTSYDISIKKEYNLGLSN
ncbi:MAG: CHASE2 domain-containing protein [Nitrospinales bacterium]